MRHCSLRWPRLALPLGVGGRITMLRARTPNSDGKRLPSSPSPSIHDGIWRCATPKAPRQLPSLTPPDRAIQPPEANSRLDKTWGQGHESTPNQTWQGRLTGSTSTDSGWSLGPARCRRRLKKLIVISQCGRPRLWTLASDPRWIARGKLARSGISRQTQFQ